MKRIPLLTLVSAVAVFMSFSATAQQKIAVIDLEKLVRLHPNTAEDRKTFEKTFKEFSAEKEALQAETQRTRKEFETAAREATNPALSDSKRKAAEEAAIAKRDAALAAEKKAIDTLRDRQRQLDEQERTMLKRTIDQIEVCITRYAESKGIDLVLPLPSSKASVGAVIYSKPELDITPAIMELLGIKETETVSSEPVAVPSEPKTVAPVQPIIPAGK